MNAAIKIDKVSKKFRKTMALDSVSFEVPSGSIFALLGDNGAGKTTLIKSMLGFVHPDQGRVEVLGMNAKNRNSKFARASVMYLNNRSSMSGCVLMRSAGL